MFQRQPSPDEIAPISFPTWKEALGQSHLAPAIRASHLAGILGFLRHCKNLRAPVTVALIKTYLAGLEAAGGARADRTRDALRWFYKEARKVRTAGGADGGGHPRPAVGGRWSALAVRGPQEGAGAEEARGPPLQAAARSGPAGAREATKSAQEPGGGGGGKGQPRPERPRDRSTPTLARDDLGGADWRKSALRSSLVVCPRRQTTGEAIAVQ